MKFSALLQLFLFFNSIPRLLIGQALAFQQTIWFKMESYIILPEDSVQAVHMGFSKGFGKDFHEISGIDYDPNSRKWLLAGDKGGTLFVFDAVISPSTSTTYDTGIVGLESIRYDGKAKRIYYVQEKDNFTTVGWFPFDIVNNKLGSKSEITSHYIPHYYNNRGYEGLMLFNGNIWACFESGDLSTKDVTSVNGERPPFTAIQTWSQSSLKEGLKLSVPFERKSCIDSFNSSLGNGISEILQLNKDRFLILERCFDGDKGTVKLFEAVIQFENVQKHEIFCFKSQGSFKPENIEGMTWGESTKDGHRTLVLISDDNNYSKKLKTSLIKLTEVRPNEK